MHVTAHLDIDMLAVGHDEELTCLVELTAPTPPALETRPGQAVVIVLDRSASMGGAPIESARRATSDLVRRLSPQDMFGLVVFDDSADVVVPVTRILECDQTELLAAIASVAPGGSTDLSAGYLMGLREASRAVSAAATGSLSSATVLVLSDGHANAGVTDPDVLGDVAAQAQQRASTTTSTLGLGDGYDEELLAALARAGAGEHRYAPDVDAAVAEFAGLVDDLLTKSVTGALLRVLPQQGLVPRIRVHGALPSRAEGDGVVINLGDLYSGEERRVLVGLRIPGLDRLGTATVADLVLEYTSLPDLVLHTVTLPVSINVVPGDEARGRVPDPRVSVERLIAEVDDVKRTVATSLRVGDVDAAKRDLTSTIERTRTVRDRLDGESGPHTEMLRTRLDGVLEDLSELESTASHESFERSSKLAMESWNQTSRGKQRRTARARGPRPSPVDPDATTLIDPPAPDGSS